MVREPNFISLTIVSFLCLQIYQVTCIKEGSQARRGDWPFVVALYSSEEGAYQCGGTIISNKHILTAASCIQGKGWSHKKLPSDIFVRLGAYNLTEKSESHVEMNISEIHIHPDWNIYTDNYDANIAILVLRDIITFTNYIRQVSLPPDDVIIDGASIDVNGTVVGWGLADKKTHEEILRQADIQALPSIQCSQKDNRIVDILSVRTFCGTYINGNPNRGDSGGGFFVESDSRWVQYGIISAILLKDMLLIDRSALTIYTNVKQYKDWVMDILNKN